MQLLPRVSTVATCVSAICIQDWDNTNEFILAVLPPLHTHTLGWDESCQPGFRMGHNKNDSPNMQHGIAVSGGALAGGCTVHTASD